MFSPLWLAFSIKVPGVYSYQWGKKWYAAGISFHACTMYMHTHAHACTRMHAHTCTHTHAVRGGGCAWYIYNSDSMCVCLHLMHSLRMWSVSVCFEVCLHVYGHCYNHCMCVGSECMTLCRQQYQEGKYSIWAPGKAFSVCSVCCWGKHCIEPVTAFMACGLKRVLQSHVKSGLYALIQ